MTTWANDELNTIARAEELQIAALRDDGTLRKPVTIWVVRVGDDLYIRSVYGRGSGWYRGTQTRRAGHIRAGGVDKDVTFVEEADPDINEQIDLAYRTKYRRHVAAVVGEIPGAHPSIAFLFHVWTMPTLLDLSIMCGLGFVWAAWMYFMTRAYSVAQASVVAPFEYASLPINIIWGFIIWHELPTMMTVAGAFLTLLSGMYILSQEQQEGSIVDRSAMDNGRLGKNI